MTTKQTEGYDMMKGAARYVAEIILICFILVCMGTLLRNAFGWGVDDSDKDGWNRSGLTIHKDAKTGIEYLSDRHGGLVRRDAR